MNKVVYENWLHYVFDNQVDEDQLNADEVSILDTLHVDELTENFTRMCKEFSLVGSLFTMEQIDQGLWLLLGSYLSPSLTECLVDVNGENTKQLDLRARLEAIQAIFYVYSDFVSQVEAETLGTCFEMLWHVVCNTFWTRCELARRCKHNRLASAFEIQQATALLAVELSELATTRPYSKERQEFGVCGRRYQLRSVT